MISKFAGFSKKIAFNRKKIRLASFTAIVIFLILVKFETYYFESSIYFKNFIAIIWDN